MRCFYCNKNEAVKSHEQVRKGVAERSYYCLSCYERLFLYNQGGEDASLSVCPYCGTKIEEIKTQKMVGCPHCYREMYSGILPTIVRMQGGEVGHRGKKILLSYEGEQILKGEEFLTPEEEDTFRDKLAESERLRRQKWEMEELIAYLGAVNPERSMAYREKLSTMQRTGKTEEEIVW